MALDTDCRCMLEFDSDFLDIDSQFSSVEESLDKACDQMQTILQKISTAESRLEMCRRSNKTSAVVMLCQRIKMLKSMYNIYYQFAEQKSEQLLFLEQERSRTKDGAEEDITLAPQDDFMW